MRKKILKTMQNTWKYKWNEANDEIFSVFAQFL